MADTNFCSFADVSDITIPTDSVYHPWNLADYDDVLKFSNAKRITGDGITVWGGRENCIDFNRTCEDIDLSRLLLIGGEQSAIVIKGGSKRIRLHDVRIKADPAAWCDVLIGDWSDQSTAVSDYLTLSDVRRPDGQPVRVVVGRATRPQIIGGNCKVIWLDSLALKAYWWTKYAGRRIGVG